MLCISSLSNGGGNGSALATLNSGGTIILATQVHPDYIMRMIEQHKVTTMIAVPTVTSLIVNTPSCHKYDRSSLRSVISIAAPFVPELKLKALEFFGNIVYDVLGTTECGAITVQTPEQMKTHLSSVGQAVCGSIVKIIKEDGEVAEPYEVGEITSQTLSMFSGYLNKGGFDQFVSAGDLGYMDEDNYVYIVGRKNDMIITGGNNVYPEEVEAVLNSCPGVIESAVIGTPDDRWGEIVTAFVVGMPMADLYELCKNNLANYKIPRKLTFVDSIPKNEAGKILRKNLRNSYK
jgi:acyl-CoA synthetase (AMP-forming)/AMP-acid ligase II